MYGQAIILFNGYMVDPSTKDNTHLIWKNSYGGKPVLLTKNTA